jgi:hypothetical protein
MSASTMTMEKANRTAQALIAELDQANEIWRADFAKLKAENAKLREAAIDAVEYMRLTSPHPSEAMDNLYAALQEGE